MEKEESKAKGESKRKNTAKTSGKRASKMRCLAEAQFEAPTPSSTTPQPYTPHTVTLTMPNEKSMKHVLRCALDAAICEMARDKNAPPGYYSHHTAKIEGQLDSYNKKCLTVAQIEAPTPSPIPTTLQRYTPHTVTLTMPSARSMKHVLRCALDTAICEMAKDKNAPPGYYSHHAAKIEGQLDSYKTKS